MRVTRARQNLNDEKKSLPRYPVIDVTTTYVWQGGLPLKDPKKYAIRNLRPC